MVECPLMPGIDALSHSNGRRPYSTEMDNQERDLVAASARGRS
jgi:hypothetical protein